MATANIINITSSGIVKYDGAGTFTAAALPLNVANGGTGDSSLTAYAVLCGGTTSTNPVQSIASVGTSGQFLTSNGAGMLPTFQTVTATVSGNSFSLYTTQLNLADSQTYYFPNNASVSTSNLKDATRRFYTPVNTTINSIIIYSTYTVNATSENSSFYIRVNDTTDNLITSTLTFTSSPTIYTNTSVNIALSAGDFFAFKMTTPAWVTNPQNVSFNITAVTS